MWFPSSLQAANASSPSAVLRKRNASIKKCHKKRKNKPYESARKNIRKRMAKMYESAIDSFREGLEPSMLGVCNLRLKDWLKPWAKVTSRRARETWVLVSISEFLRTASLIVSLQRVSIACYAKHCISYRKSVRLSVRLSVRRWHCVKTTQATITGSSL